MIELRSESRQAETAHTRKITGHMHGNSFKRGIIAC